MSLREIARPRTLAEASQTLMQLDGEGKLVAGGTALVLMHRQRLVDPEVLVALGGVTDPMYRGISADNAVIRIGGGETLAEIASSALVRARLPALATACGLVGNIRIRNRATLGGNLAEADYASDPPSVLVSLGARAVVTGPDGVRCIPCESLITGFYETAITSEEVIAMVEVPIPRNGVGTAYVRYSSRSSEDRPCVGVAAVIAQEGGRVRYVNVVVGAVSDTPQVVPDALRPAVGQPSSAATFRGIASRYADEIVALDDDRASRWYRSQMIKVHVERALITAAGAPA